MRLHAIVWQIFCAEAAGLLLDCREASADALGIHLLTIQARWS